MYPRLSDHVYVADVDGDLVFLDARANAYYCIARSETAPVRAVLAGAPAPADDPRIEPLIASGLLEMAETARVWTGVQHRTPYADFHLLGVADRPMGVRAWLGLAAAAVTGWRARLWPKPVKWLTRRRAAPNQIPVTRAATIALEFDRLRPLVFGSGGCLVSSIMLLEYLRRHGIDADWVFGVRTFPFDAHCWVEFEGVVLNDVAEHVGWFTPIAAS